MTLAEAQELAASIKREAPDAATTIERDEPRGNSYHVEVHKPNVIQFAVRSISQWNERKHLL
jgi:hypothetical protein